MDDLERHIFSEYKIESGNYYKKIKESEQFKIFESLFQESVNNITDCINAVVTKSGEVNLEQLLDSVKKITDDFNPDVSLFDMIHCIEGYDDLTYIHSINVALIARVIGNWMGMSPEECDTLTICGLLHDIGKVMIPVEIITKPSRLSPTEYALIQTHTIHGYNLLENIELDERIKLAALQHHERCDGTGYPNGYNKDQIDKYSKIIAISAIFYQKKHNFASD